MAGSKGKKPQQTPKEAILEEQKQHSKQDDGDMENSALDKQAADSDAKSTDPEEDFPEYIYIDEDILDDYLKCKICLEIMTEVRAIKACYHRLCKNCIYKQVIRLGKKWCPFCKAPCPTLRSTVKDVKFGAFIRHFLPYMKKEDDKLSEDDKTRNAQLQAKISSIDARYKIPRKSEKGIHKWKKCSSSFYWFIIFFLFGAA